jgi:RNA polymerase sigma-70 factor (ECF subfamily)
MPDERKSGEAVFDHPGIALDKKEKAAVLFKAVSALPEKQRLAFTLIKMQGLSYIEAAAILQQNTKAIESLISRATKNLQVQLQIYYDVNIK